MRRILLFALLLLPLGTNAYDFEEDGYRSMLVNGRSWYYEGESVLDHRLYYFSLLVNGDTIVDNQLCKKIYYVEGDSSHIKGFAYEKEGKVYKKLKSDDPVIDQLLPWDELYDFTLDVGEKNDQYIIWLSSTDSLSIDDVTYHRYYYSRKEGGSSTNTFVWIEGIGSEYGLLNPIGMFPMNSYVIERFLRCYDGERCIITAEDFHRLSVNSISIPETTLHKKTTIYDLSGRKLPSLQVGGRLHKGVYIQKGKKFVVK